MQWPGVDADVYEGALLVPARQGNHGDPGGGQAPPSTVLPVLHAGAVKGPEWDARAHGTMHSESGTEEEEFSGGG